ncbi:MAG: hypothetical protein KQI62_02210 [Deltaproteobacteria bacterium]|nr:hypothetical protein [Deltaproteobacteria bacterium]
MLTPPPTLIRREAVRCLTQEDTEGGYPTPAMDRVWPAHKMPLLAGKATWPLLLVYINSEGVDGQQDNVDVHTLEMEIEAYAIAKDSEVLDDLMDLIALSVYRTVEINEGWFTTGPVLSLRYQGFDKVHEFKGAQFSCLLTLRWTVRYTIPLLESDALDDFLRFHGDYDLATADGQLEASDDVTLPGPEEE